MKQLISSLALSIVLRMFTACQDTGEQYVKEGKARLDQGAFTEAISLFDEAIKVNKKNHDAFNARGVAHYLLEDHVEALNDFDKAIALHQGAYKYYYNRGNVKRKLNNPADAIADYTLALSIDSTVYEVYLNRGLGFLTLNRFMEALQDFDKAEETGGYQDKSVYIYRGKVHFRLEMYREALGDFRKVVNLDESFGEAWHSLALTQLILEGKATEETCMYLQKSVAGGFAAANELIDTYCKGI